MRFAALLTLLLTQVPLTAAAAGPGPRCPTSLPQAEINECFEQAAEETQARLDGLLRELKRTLSKKNWSLIKQSHNLWADSRELDCKVKASFIDSPARDAVHWGCREQRTRERMHQLRYYLCPRYNLTGQCEAARRYE